jgi:RAT1-interacting protein
MEKRGGCVYLDVRRTQQEVESNSRPHENQRRGAFAGRRFEIFATHPREGASARDGDADRQVDEAQEFCSISSVTLGGKRLVVAAEIDCCEEAKADGTPGNVELKTFRLLEREKDRFVFERFKLLAFWIQSYLVGTPKIVCGFRDEDFVVRKLQTFKTADLPGFGRKYWVRSGVWSDPITLAFKDMLLTHVCELVLSVLGPVADHVPELHQHAAGLAAREGG